MINRKVIDIVIIVIAVFAAYLFYINGKFIWDDDSLIVENHSIRSLKNVGTILSQNDIGSGSGSVYNFYRPLQTISYALDYFCWGLKPAGYHLTNIFLHIAVAILIYGLINILYANRLLAFFAALLFAVHPVHSEAVAYISCRADLLFVFFTLLCIFAYFYHLKNGASGYVVLSFFAYFLALLSKESAFIMIPLLLWTAYCFNRKIKPAHLIYFVLITFAYSALRFTVSGTFAVLKDTVLAQRAPGVFAAIFEYWRILFFPVGLHMEYGRKFFHFYDCFVIAGIFLVALSLAYIAYRRTLDKSVLFPFGWFFIAIFPMLNIYPINAYMAEHWLYLPSLGFFLMLAQWLANRKNIIVRNWTVASLILVYLILHVNHSSYWSNPVVFYKQTLRYSPKSARIYFNLGKEYEAAGNYAQAIEAYKAAASFKHNYKECLLRLGNVYAKTKDYQKAEAIYKQIITDNPAYPEAYANLAILNVIFGHKAKAIELFKCASALSADTFGGMSGEKK
jgi:hypothetical protein